MLKSQRGDAVLFENERFNISKIYNVVNYAPREHSIYKYPGRLPTYELMYYISGETTLTFDGKSFEMTPGSILYLPKGLDNNEFTVKVKKDFSLYNIYFDTAEQPPQTAIQITSVYDELKSSYEKIYRTWLGKREGYYYKCMQLAYGIFDRVRQIQVRYMPGSKQTYLSAAEEYIASHYCDLNFDFDRLVDLSGLSYSYFKKLFVDKFGCPPVKYVNRLKIRRACELLQTGHFSVSEIAKLCGYENVYYFSNVFKKQMGVSPKNYNPF